MRARLKSWLDTQCTNNQTRRGKPSIVPEKCAERYSPDPLNQLVLKFAFFSSDSY